VHGSNLHGTLVAIADKGVLITGASGSGKSTLALKLLAFCKVSGVPAQLVSDDQVLLSVDAGQLVGTVPETIAGLIEVWGVGPTPISHVRSAVIDLVVTLVPPDEAPRLNDDVNETLVGITIRKLELAGRNAEGGVLAIMAKLSLGLFAPD
jgi:serine kinase of HPr protein (carbohydrate metabolism regulator)